MAKIKAEIEVGNGECCDNCPMFNLFQYREREAFCSLFKTFLAFSPQYLSYVRCDKCKEAEVKEQ